MRNSTCWYTVYEADSDNLLVIGSAEECAAFLGMSTGAFRSMVSKVKSGKIKSYCIAWENLKTNSYAVYGGENTGEIQPSHKKIDDDIAYGLYQAGMLDAEIAKELGVCTPAVFAWRKRTGLSANAKQGRPRRDAK